ncbi:tRNA (adenosine(37)-N6)-threonylcarbamoyltransferase complex dimerization subunit type 1 TsaB [Stenoxybacter acetivorans]|uniref:tRNA (adenosine(37)-N6)-threonylcarbamoyltransferase complex dimerization subunit type 1 TsaB n=1 Tax=Stenoxybacter acetivorans TaxID=422441 RepID=UPI00055AB134|nr:tRNA (adenosine(37)-N6)-threonylcarbamoyltransferase complex dimerization subunit type 1 TsaB [Stenoxybacter acetivorans]
MNPHPTHLLAIDTSTSFLSLGLYHHEQIDEVYEEAGNRQSEIILPRIKRLLDTANLSLPQLNAIVYAQGPGAFTGLRIGIGVAQGLAAAFNTPLIGIPCLDALASLMPNQPCVLAAADARMNELFYAWYNTQKQQRLSHYCVGRADEIRLPENYQHAVGVGNAFALTADLPVFGENRMPQARHYLQLALSGNYPAVDAAHAELLYVRNKIALTAAEQAVNRVNTL